MGKNIEATAQYCAEQASDLFSGEKALMPEVQEILQRRFALAIGHKVRVHSGTMTRAEVEVFAGAAIPPNLIPVFCLAVGVTPEGFPAFAAQGFLADHEPTPEEIKRAERGALDAFGYGNDVPRFTIEQGTRH
ncbi:hypothetical protein [Paracoccus endophyticus]|uniref:hypothetical protein n=1 Tax=Paracoccus endophyticus TaxID=2233774 RepID=UPI000DD78335|nr:hypothetical protein [Paracoccus endophyticus]